MPEFEVVDASYKLQQSDIVSGDGLEVALASLFGFADPPLVDGLSLQLLALEIVVPPKPKRVLLQEDVS